MLWDEFVKSVFEFQEKVRNAKLLVDYVFFKKGKTSCMIICRDKECKRLTLKLHVNNDDEIVIDTFTDETFPMNRQGLELYLKKYKT